MLLNFLNNQKEIYDNFNKGLISEGEATRQIRDNALDGTIAADKAALEALKTQLAGTGSDQPELIDELRNKIAALEAELSKLKGTAKGDVLGDLKDDFESIIDSAERLAQAFQAIGDVSFDNQKVALQEIGAQEDKKL